MLRVQTESGFQVKGGKKNRKERERGKEKKIDTVISSDKQRKRVDSFAPKELFKRIVAGMRVSFFEIRRRETRRTRLRVMHMRYVPEIPSVYIYIYIYTAENLTHVPSNRITYR